MNTSEARTCVQVNESFFSPIYEGVQRGELRAKDISRVDVLSFFYLHQVEASAKRLHLIAEIESHWNFGHVKKVTCSQRFQQFGFHCQPVGSEVVNNVIELFRKKI